MGVDEYWDVTDEEGALTGEIYRRGTPDWPVKRHRWKCPPPA